MGLLRFGGLNPTTGNEPVSAARPLAKTTSWAFDVSVRSCVVMDMRVLGLDVGIASVGWSLLDLDRHIVVGAGVWMHDPPEEKTQSGRKLLSEERRTFRGQRRVVRRRRQRMNAIRRLFFECGLLDEADRDALRAPDLDPWTLRVEGLERALTPRELAVAFGHIARHRGFKSSAKSAGRNDADDGKMLKASAETREKLAKFGTPARMLMAGESFVLRETKRSDGGTDTVRRLRNRDGDYSRSLLRDDLAAEVREIFRAQRRFGAGHATADLEERFQALAFHQRPLQDSERMVADCPFEKGEMRAAKRGWSFERFRYLSRLNNLRLVERGERPRPLTEDQVVRAVADFGASAKISFYTLRKKLGLADGVDFEGVKREEESKRDVVARSGEAAAGSARLRKLIAGAHGETTWRSLIDNHPERLDRAAEVLSFRNDLERIALGLTEAGLPEGIRDTLLEAVRRGDLDVFTGAGHISAKAARAICPGLLEGRTYDKACAAVGYDHTVSRERHALDTGAVGKEALARLIKGERISRDIVGSPTARHALIEALKQVKAIVETHGMPDCIHVELARDVGKSIEEREEIERGIKKRNAQKDKLRALFLSEIGRPVREGQPGVMDLLKFELWQQQNGRCLYTGEYIFPHQIEADDNSIEVDHILPWSRFGDDSFNNKTLCLTRANREKKDCTPYEWFEMSGPRSWDAFVADVKAIPYMKGMKRRNYLLQNAGEVADRFRARNLNDTRWACRLLAEALRQALPDLDEGEVDRDGRSVKTRRVFTRPGALTDRLRRAWGLQRGKKDALGKRIPDDRNHALDAAIVAGTTESLMQSMTRKMQEEEAERRLSGQTVRSLTRVMAECPPWPGFADDMFAALEPMFVARAERRRARGKAHEATIRRIGEKDGQEVVYERKRVGDLKVTDLERIADPERNAALIAGLRAWIEAGSPKDTPPLSPKGDPIGKVRLISKGKVAVRLHGGTVDRGEMARVDVFCKATPKGVRQYFLVPIYPHEIATRDAPPDRAVAASKPESEWPVMDDTFEFLWSLVPMTPLRVVDKNGTIFFPDQPDGNVGYFRGVDRTTGAIALSSVVDQTVVKTGIGARTLDTLQKLTVDRLGQTFAVGRETRTWRGKVCT